MALATIYLDKQTYFVHTANNWKILIKEDSNSTVYVPFSRKSWQNGGEIEIFSLLPPDGSGDEPLLHIRIYTKANTNNRVPPLLNPPISLQSRLPVFTIIEPEKQQVRVELMCILSVEGRRLKVTPLLDF